jgi:hypothetical protein
MIYLTRTKYKPGSIFSSHHQGQAGSDKSSNWSVTDTKVNGTNPHGAASKYLATSGAFPWMWKEHLEIVGRTWPNDKYYSSPLCLNIVHHCIEHVQIKFDLVDKKQERKRRVSVHVTL